MMQLRHTYPFCILMVVLGAFSSCAIKDDLPLPIKKAEITAFEVEGQCNELDTDTAAAVIDKEHRTVDVFVSDTVNIAALSIKRFEVSNEATIIPEQNSCLCPNDFPSTSFTDSAKNDVCSKVDFSKGTVAFTLRTYQDYQWTVNVHQVILREIQIEGQVGDAVIDPINRNAIVYVDADMKLDSLQVHRFSLGGQHGTVSPDPTDKTYDFSKMRPFTVRMANSYKAQEWQVIVYKKTVDEKTVDETVIARSVSTTISGRIPNGTQPLVEYHASGTDQWTAVSESNVKVDKTRFTAELTGIRPETDYTYRVTAGNKKSEGTFRTAPAEQLENAGFEEWSISSEKTASGNDLLQPWGEGKKPYWGTGNPGATIAGPSNSTYLDEGGRRFANLKSKYFFVKFAAGNIFTGDYLETDGTDGVLSFGRPFTSFPTKMRFDYKYKTSPITKTSKWKEPWGKYISRPMYESLKGKNDICCVYVALGDWEPQKYTYQYGEKKGQTIDVPYLIRTKPSTLNLMDLNDPHLIAYGELSKGEDVPDSNLSSWVTETIDINYRVTDRQPKYIIVVASSSKYGDYFTGGEESLLQLDNIELLYE